LVPDSALNLSIHFGHNTSDSSKATAHFTLELHLTRMPERNKTVTFGVLYQETRLARVLARNVNYKYWDGFKISFNTAADYKKGVKFNVTDLWVRRPENGFNITLGGTSDAYLTPDNYNATNITTS